MMRSATAPTRLVAAAVAVLAALVLAGCSSTHKSAVSKNAVPKAAGSSKIGDPLLPTGWVRYSYKALSVGAPAGWKVSSSVLHCFWPANTVDEFTVDNPIELASSCPDIRTEPTPVQSIVIECLTGRAGHLFSGPGSTTIVDWRVLHHPSPSSVYLQGDGWQAAVTTNLPAPLSFAEKVMATVEPTGRAC